MRAEYSFDKVNYSLRPAKQVERKVLVELLHQVSTAMPGYDVRNYTYVGFGSVYYTDFILFHKYLYMDRMICVEGAPIEERMRFNQPYEFIDLRMGRFSDVVPSLPRDCCYVMWLDFDTGITAEHLGNVADAIQMLPPGSVFLVTLDAEPRIPDKLRDPLVPTATLRKRAVRLMSEECGSLFPEDFTLRHFTRERLPTVLAAIVRNQIEDAARSRGDVEFAQLINFRYEDGAQMVSLGGVVDRPSKVSGLMSSSVTALPFVNLDAEPRWISVPHLTLRERLWLEKMSKSVAETPNLEEKVVRDFQEYYRYYPSYYEALL